MVSREELYRLVWSQPMTKVARQFDVSDSYLARICAQLNVPRPERGYWAKREFGKAPPQTPLPAARPGDPLHWRSEEGAVPLPKPKAPPIAKRRRRARIPRDQVHELIRGAKPHFENTRRIDDGAYLKPYKKLLVDVTASLSGLDKALDLANTLFNALEAVGHRVILAPAGARLGRQSIDEHEIAAKPREPWEYNPMWSPIRPTVVYVGTVAIGLAVVEMSEHVTLRYVGGSYIRENEYSPSRGARYAPYSWTTNSDVPSGRMRIIAYAPYPSISWSRQWQEKKSGTLGGQLRQIVKDLEAAAPLLVEMLEEAERDAAIRHQQWLEDRERDRRREDRRRIEQSLSDSKTDLQQIIKQWSEVTAVERFLDGIDKRAAQLPQAEKRKLDKRLALAREFLGSQDPFDFFLGWKTPEERYVPKYTDESEEAHESEK